jgi:hypothetical protein
LNVGSLQTLRSADNLEFDGLPLVEGAVAVALDGGEMDENVLAALALDETKSFAGVKPLHCTLFFHRSFPFQIIKLSDAFFVREAAFAVNRASFADSDDTAVRRAGTKKPRAEACGALRQTRNKSNKRKCRIAQDAGIRKQELAFSLAQRRRNSGQLDY